MRLSLSLRGLLVVFATAVLAAFTASPSAFAENGQDSSDDGPPKCDPFGPGGPNGSPNDPNSNEDFDRERRLRDELDRERRNNDEEQRRRDEALERERRQRELEDELERERQRHNQPGEDQPSEPGQSEEPTDTLSSSSISSSKSDEEDSSDEPSNDPRCPGGPGGGPDGSTPDFARGFLRQVLKLSVSVDFYDEDEQTVTATIDKLTNSKRSFKKKYNDDIDELKDEEAIFKVSRKSKLYVNGKRIRSQKDWSTYLDGDQELTDVQIDAKMVRPDKWIEDPDEGLPVMTLTLKKIKVKI